ncbi:MAG: 50S ribosomal protein L29 [Syntrophales bacterium]|mgnify:CR=1 FL=1|nr:50S ribosomal protein L29 [Syntrophales bacterium]MDD5233552.1 50S ribosomal protein L29 [Syntrophales bacterium]MDD5531751.1 50S ribosomal protein L29 [Syntrophales bacterium]HPL63951.1 50S ribosomal protein L29 [Syntrophales bacterium]
MKISEIRDLSLEELKKKENDLADELFRLRFRQATGQLESVAAKRKIRRDIARVKTVRKEREALG